MPLRFHSILIQATVLLAAFSSCSALVKFESSDTRILYEGRFEHIDSGAAFDMPGNIITIRFSGSKQVAITLSAIVVIPNRFWVYIDGVKSSVVVDTRNMANNTETLFNIASELDSTAIHTVSLVKITEAQYNALVPQPNYVTLNNFVLDDGARLLPIKDFHRKIEFIGDSITAGFCDLCDTVDPLLGDYAKESFAISHPYLTCSKLNASCHTAAWSGYGVIRNCCGGETLMPEIYTRTLASVSGSRWDFSHWIPDVVVVNLGTNDHLNSSNPEGDAETSFVKTYTALLRNISVSYPNAVLFASCGPLSHEYCPFVSDAVSTLMVNDGITVNFVFYEYLSASDQCCGHPSDEAQAKLASQLSAQISLAMNWN